MAVWQTVLLDRLREFLKDPAPPFLWTDTLLRLALDDAIVAYSLEFPRQFRVVATTTAGQTQFDAEQAVTGPCYTPDQRQILSISRVECPPLRVLRERPFTPVDPGGEGLAVQNSYYVIDTSVIFRNPLAGVEVGTDQLVIHGTAAWQRFSVDSADPATAWNFPGYDHALLLLYAARYAWRQASLQGLKTPTDLDPGNVVTELDFQIDRMLKARRRQAHSYRLGVN